MKILALSFFLACTIKIAKADTAPDFTAILSDEDRTQVLELVSEACQTSWCTGRYDFKFKSFSCDENSATCRLRFKIMDRGFIPGKFSEKHLTCVFSEIKSADQILIRNRLTENFFQKLDSCLTLAVSE